MLWSDALINPKLFQKISFNGDSNKTQGNIHPDVYNDFQIL